MLRNKVTREELFKMYYIDRLSTKVIGDHFGTKRRNVVMLMQRWDMPRRYGAKQEFTEEELQQIRERKIQLPNY